MRTPGEEVVLVQVWKGKIWSSMPAVVVRDADDLTVLYVRGGTTVLSSTSRCGGGRRPAAAEGIAVRSRVAGVGTGSAVGEVTAASDAHRRIELSPAEGEHVRTGGDGPRLGIGHVGDLQHMNDERMVRRGVDVDERPRRTFHPVHGDVVEPG